MFKPSWALKPITLLWFFFKTFNVKNGECEVKCKSDECVMALQDVALIISKVELFSERVYYLKSQLQMLTEFRWFCPEKTSY